MRSGMGGQAPCPDHDKRRGGRSLGQGTCPCVPFEDSPMAGIAFEVGFFTQAAFALALLIEEK
ncbi:hypothetical protein HF072_17050 [Bacillus sp. RO3]|nr:hypothetical protein [Bacillus sp. RO3]